MAISELNVRKQWEQLRTQTREQEGEGTELKWASWRMDVDRLQPFIVKTEEQSRNKKVGLLSDDAVELFWSQFHPTRLRLTVHFDNPEHISKGTILELQTETPAEPLSPEDETWMLECLEYLYVQHQVPYVPDSDDWRREGELIVYLHIAAARAFRLQQSERGDRPSEEVLNCLNEVERTMSRLERADIYSDYPAYNTSTFAVVALVLMELSRVSRNSGDYTRALSYMAKAIYHYDAAVWDNNDDSWKDMLDPDDLYHEDGSPTELNKVESALRHTIKSNLTGLQVSLEEASKVFESVKAKSQSIEDWNQVTEDCRRLENAWDVSGREEEVTVDRGVPLTWKEYWLSAGAWASAQLSPSEYRKMRDEDEKDAAERRLKRYFFGESWPTLPSRAQAALKSADQTWNSKESGRRESILNELLRATEEMCYEYIWRPLSDSGESSLDFLKFEASSADRSSSLTARDYIRLCEQGFFRDFLRQRKLDGKDVQFLRENLPSVIRQLIDRRNPAEHETGSTIPHETVDDCFKTYLGIGKRGVLPELARIGLRLRGGRRRKG